MNWNLSLNKNIDFSALPFEALVVAIQWCNLYLRKKFKERERNREM